MLLTDSWDAYDHESYLEEQAYDRASLALSDDGIMHLSTINKLEAIARASTLDLPWNTDSL